MTARLLPRPAFHGQLAIRRTDPVCCPICGRTVPRKARQQRFCSARCRGRGKEHTRGKERSRKASPAETAVQTIKNGVGYPTTGAPTTPPEKANGFNLFGPPKSGSSIALQAPPRVIEAEVFGGRVWRQVVSPGGVVCEVGALRKRALQSDE
jgi:hypothetical protein